MSEHMRGQYASEPTIAELVKDVVHDSIARERAAAQQGLSELPFRERMRARRKIRPQSSLAIVSGQPYRRTPAPRPVARARPAPIVAPAPTAAPAADVADSAGPVVIRPQAETVPARVAASVPAAAMERPGPSGADTSQFAFAAIAVLGLAGLSYMAAENALTAPLEPEADPFGPEDMFAGDASALALAAASEPVGEAALEMAEVLDDPVLPQMWDSAFDFARLVADLEVHSAEYELALAEAAERAALVRQQAEAFAATAVADAEAARIVEEQRLIAEAEIARIAAEEAEKVRLAEAEAARVAEAEALRLAQLEVEREAAERAEARRVARVEAERLARAEAEAQRLAQEKAVRLATLEAARKQQSQDIFLGAATVSAPKQANAPTILFVPHEGSVPQLASLKPSKPPQIKAMARPSAPVTRTPPPVLKAATPTVRPLAQPKPVVQSGPQTADAFLASRVTRTASAPIAPAALDGFKQDFVDFVAKGADGSALILATPDGRGVSVQIEQTVTRQAHKTSVRTVEYAQAASGGSLVVSGLTPEQVSITCRDVAYSFAGQERGRFAACLGPSGDWVLSRASDKKKIQVAALPELITAGLR